jgi:hypothetical protein
MIYHNSCQSHKENITKTGRYNKKQSENAGNQFPIDVRSLLSSAKQRFLYVHIYRIHKVGNVQVCSHLMQHSDIKHTRMFIMCQRVNYITDVTLTLAEKR